MGLRQFRQFYPVMRLYQVLHQGTFLANRWAPETGLSLYYYHYPGNGRSFFVEDSLQASVLLGQSAR